MYLSFYVSTENSSDEGLYSYVHLKQNNLTSADMDVFKLL